ncbi:hypothetical protein [Psychroserpens sp. NJDZ02]|uniref:hypothetical protein n=1 Tax=Psychroserpens sp. NJDZ02 TaxID=2570561 RepID=UPI0010A8DF48|nr:hypothetical protein [Psychroserpens sp. NJDZ02]QCE42417.1 hypothetical protein E9099_13745 [Psychroserpens sp. NJDZ02]
MRNFKTLLFAVTLSLNSIAFSQVGIGTTTPDPSAVLDINSTDKGILAPRLTSAQRMAIVSPADGLLVYDTTESAFYYYEVSTWEKMDAEKRDNHKLIKSEADLADELAAGGGSEYLLSSNTLYEINGTIMLAFSINLNNAFVKGVDTNEDILIKTGGAMFTGTAGGSIKDLTLSAPGGAIFNMSGSSTSRLTLRDSVVANSGSVGSISGYGLVFFSIVQYSGNTTGIIFNDIYDLLLNNQGWSYTNTGTYETFTGTFNIIEKQGGFSEVNGSAIGVDISSNPTVANGILTGASFSGTSTQYINGYTVGSYPGYNFDNSWSVDCPGLPAESDQLATGHLYYNGAITSGFLQNVTNGVAFNLSGNSNSNTTTTVNLLRVSSPQNNRLLYEGKKTRTFQISGSLSVRGNINLGDYYAFFIRKNGTTTLTETNTLMRVNVLADITSNSISGTVELEPGDYIEIWGEKLVGSIIGSSIAVFSLNLNIK